MKKLRHIVEYVITLILVGFIRILPVRLGLAFGAFLGRLFWIIGVRRRVAERNFRLCFGERFTKSERNKILARSYENFVRSAVEFVIMPKLLRKGTVKFDGIEYLKELANKRSGAILVTGHFGNWELFGAALAHEGIPIGAVVARQANRMVDKLINSIRKKCGIKVIYQSESAFGIIKALKSGRQIALLSDQDAHERGVVVRFFGKEASTPKGPALIALKTGVPIVFGVITRESDGMNHIAKIFEPIYPPKNTKSVDDTVYQLTSRITKMLENAVEKEPEQYFWMHRRFKSTLGY